MTQHYVGTKIIEAWPSNKTGRVRVCGIDCRRGDEHCTGYCHDPAVKSAGPLPDEHGYAVKYADGYTSWSPTEVFEQAYIPLGHIGNLAPHEQRMVAELAELDHRLAKLCAFLETPAFQSLGDQDRHDLELQANCMRAYANVLTARVERINR